MFTGRDEDITDDERYARRYPASQLAYDLQEQTAIGWRPMRDWFPASAYGIFGHLCDVLHPEAKVGSLFCDIHPNHGIFSPLLVNVDTKETIPVAAFFNVERFMHDIVEITDSGRRPVITKALLALSVLHNFDQDRAPSGLGIRHLRGLLEDCFYRVACSGENWSERAYSHDGSWKIVTTNVMCFQDAHIYDLSTMADSTTPVATQEGEINFSVHNGAGWREVVEHIHQTATLSDWHREHSRHEIYANGKRVDLDQVSRAPNYLVQIESEPSPVSGV
jgi:uncharacterized radical SAM superfamily Fe-S cluster-containing enzyme